jgi:RND family efflux transporter MFP subunit
MPRHVLGICCTLLSLAVFSGCGGGAEAEAKGKGGAKGKKGRPPALVGVAAAKEGVLNDQWRFLGNVRAGMQAELAAGAAGSIRSISAREGDVVKKGQVILEVDPRLALARLQVAQAGQERATKQVEQAQVELARLEKSGAGAVSALELDQARSRLAVLGAEAQAARAAVGEAQAQLDLHRVRAPFDGVITMRRVDPGDWVNPGQSVLEVTADADLEVIVDGPEQLFGKVKKGDKAVLSGDGEMEAEVVGVVPALDPVARTLRVRLAPRMKPVGAEAVKADAPPPPPPLALLPGGAVDVRFSVALSESGVLVPRDALVKDARGARVVRVDEGKAKTIPVQVVVTSKTEALIQGTGIAAGDQVVIRGNERLRDGQAVRVAGKN